MVSEGDNVELSRFSSEEPSPPPPPPVRPPQPCNESHTKAFCSEPSTSKGEHHVGSSREAYTQPVLRRPPAEVLPELYRSDPHKFLLKHYQDEHSAYFVHLASHEEACRTRQNDMYQLLAMFALIQGVVFSAVSQSTRLDCFHLLLPISLSSTTSLATILALVRELRDIADLQDKIRRTRDRATAASDMVENMKLKGVDFDLSLQVEIPNPEKSFEPWRHVFSAYGMSLLAYLLLVSVVIIVSCVTVLCSECRC